MLINIISLTLYALCHSTIQGRATEPQSEHRSPSISLPCRYPLLGVKAADGVLVLDGAGRDAEAVLVAAGVVHARADPDAVRPLDAVGAGDEAGAVEREVAVLVDLEALALAVAGRGLGAGGVAELALACGDLLVQDAPFSFCHRGNEEDAHLPMPERST